MDRSTSYSDLRENLKLEFDRVCSDHEVLQIKRRNGENLILMSEEDYRSWMETFYLAKSPANHERLMASINSDESDYISYEDIQKKYPL